MTCYPIQFELMFCLFVYIQYTVVLYLYESLDSQLLVQLIECQLPSYDASLKSSLTSGGGGCRGVPLGVKTLFLHHRDLYTHKNTYTHKALERLSVNLLILLFKFLQLSKQLSRFVLYLVLGMQIRAAMINEFISKSNRK